MKRMAAAPGASTYSAPSTVRSAGGLPKATKAVPVVPRKATSAPAVVASAPPRPVPTNIDEMKVELMHCVQVT